MAHLRSSYTVAKSAGQLASILGRLLSFGVEIVVVAFEQLGVYIDLALWNDRLS